MSNEQDKIKHSKRLHKEESAIKKQMKIAKTHGAEVNIYEAHRFAKHHAMDCGNPECYLCGNPRKFGEKTIQELKFEQKGLHDEPIYEYRHSDAEPKSPPQDEMGFL